MQQVKEEAEDFAEDESKCMNDAGTWEYDEKPHKLLHIQLGHEDQVLVGKNENDSKNIEKWIQTDDRNTINKKKLENNLSQSENLNFVNVNDKLMSKSQLSSGFCEVDIKPLISSDLMQHEMVHNSFSTDHYFICEICGESFTSKQSIRTHIITHEGMMQQIKDEVEVSDVSEVELRYSDSEVEEKKILQIQIKEEVNDVLEGPVHNDYTAEYKNNFIKMPPIEICENQDLLPKANSYDSSEELDKDCETDKISTTGKLKYFNTTSQSESECLHQHQHDIYVTPDLYMCAHTTDTSFQCKICSKTFTQKFSLVRHMVIHTYSRPFQCEICYKTFTQNSHLNTHMITHTGNRLFQCDVCSKTFTQKCSLVSHMGTHTGHRPFKCEICSKTYIQKSTLNTHMITHTDNRPFKCEICGKTFAHKCTLNRHMILHKANLFQCDMCSKTFTQKCHLNTHMIKHTTNSSFQCEICSKTFTEKGNLGKHMKILHQHHSFQCEICSKTFIQKHSLVTHKIIHTGNRPFQCEICNKMFTVKRSLVRHMNTHKTDNAFPFP